MNMLGLATHAVVNASQFLFAGVTNDLDPLLSQEVTMTLPFVIIGADGFMVCISDIYSKYFHLRIVGLEVSYALPWHW